jgi:hypothetical protein
VHRKARTPLTVEAKAAAAAKRKSTRASRSTMGAKQKAPTNFDEHLFPAALARFVELSAVA